jgi:hypothetical protein
MEYGVATLLLAVLIAGAVDAAQPRSVTTQPLTMTGLGGTAPTGSSQPFAPKSVTTAALMMTGLGGAGAAAETKPFSPKIVRMQMLTMTGTRAGPLLKLPLGAAPLLLLPTPGKKP